MSDATIIREVIQPLTRSAQDYDSLLALIGDARFALLGEPCTARTSFTPSARRSQSGATLSPVNANARQGELFGYRLGDRYPLTRNTHTGMSGVYRYIEAENATKPAQSPRSRY